jgi:peptidoglycan/LPS O-acetylase OafA/YrhL
LRRELNRPHARHGKGKRTHGILTWQGAALTLCAFAISIAICAASYRFIEDPLIRSAHRKFSYGKSGRAGNELVAVART